MWERSKPIIIGAAVYLVLWGFFAGVANMSPDKGEGSVSMLWVVAGFTSWLVAPLVAGATVYGLDSSNPRRDAFLAGFLAPITLMIVFAFVAAKFPTAAILFGMVIGGIVTGMLAVAGVGFSSMIGEWAGKWPSPPPPFRQILYQRPSEIDRAEVLSALAARLWLVTGPYVAGVGACAVLKSTLVLSFFALSMIFNPLTALSVATPHWIHLVLGPFVGGVVAARYAGLRSFRGGGIIGLIGASMGLATWSDMNPAMSVPSLPIQIGFALLGAALGVAGMLAGWRMAIKAALFSSEAGAPMAEPSAPTSPSRRRVIAVLAVVIGVALFFVYATNRAPPDYGQYGKLKLVGPATVITGDTLKVAGEEFRLAYIRAPLLQETCTWRAKQWPCGQASARKLEELIGTKPLTCRAVSGSAVRLDEYICDLEGSGQGDGWLNQQMVAEGFAFAAKGNSLEEFQMKKIRKLENEAKAARRGIWVDPSMGARK